MQSILKYFWQCVIDLVLKRGEYSTTTIRKKLITDLIIGTAFVGNNLLHVYSQ